MLRGGDAVARSVELLARARVVRELQQQRTGRGLLLWRGEGRGRRCLHGHAPALFTRAHRTSANSVCSLSSRVYNRYCVVAMEEQSSADAMSDTVNPIPDTTGFDISTEEVVLILCLGLSLEGSTSPLAKMQPELVRILSDHFRAAQTSYLQGNGCLTLVGAASSQSSGPPPIQRNAPVRQAPAVLNPRVQRSLFAQPPAREGPGQ